MYITESEFRKILNKYDNQCLDRGYKFYDVTTLYEAAGFKFTPEDKLEIKKAIDANSDPEAVSALVQQKTLENDPSKKNLFKQLKENYDDATEKLIDIVQDAFYNKHYSLSEVQEYIDDLMTYNDEYEDADVDDVFACIFKDGGFEDCEWCGECYPESELHQTSAGLLCNYCIQAIKSRGEELSVKI